jgi:2-polyprenyl-3-methyl-5-hydroxy-6-metoxy-1,4-benzoquinol methylase
MSWTESQIRQKVTDLDERVGWYQDIDLGGGIHTKSRVLWGESPNHPIGRWSNVAEAVPLALTGMSVLDIGCNAGFFGLEAKRRGAERVLGVDLKEGYVEQARFCADVLELDVDFRRMDIYDLGSLGEEFDLVFFIGTLYHCKYLMRAVEVVGRISRDTLIVESAIDPMSNETPYVRFVRSSQYQGPAADGDSRLPGHWHPNMSAMKDLFREQGFQRVDELFREGGRGGIAAYR